MNYKSGGLHSGKTEMILNEHKKKIDRRNRFIKLLRFVLAIPATILFIPLAIIICCFVGIFILLPEMIDDCFEEVSGGSKE